ncbi:porin [Prevotella intermedia]|uniref:porin n=1 Tax=Prevotella intermedia TaxID=28131 RepID=UPI000C1BC9E4|nr:porin [Prevotella intermedia]ATV37259.1 porin [Prevotella intermedia]
MKIKSIIALLLLSSTTVMAQETKPVSLQVEARADYQRINIDGKKIKEGSGFKGNVVNIILKGDISPKFSYAFRNRLNGINKDYNFFNSTDWLYLKYKPNKNVSLIAGKYIVLVAGYELLPAPIDCYFLSEFCYNFPCYQWGLVGEFTTNSGNDVFSAQICQSPYQKVYENKAGKAAEMYAYNVSWNGRHGFWEPFWSVNMSEYAPHKFINYISLGNKFHLADNLQLELDYWNRAASGQGFIDKDCSVIGQVSYQPTEKLNVFAKASYEVNHAGTDADVAVMDGTELTRVGGGVEYYPLKEKNVRIHGYYSYSFGKNANPAGVVQDKMSELNIGVTWRGKVL